ncbi:MULTISPECIES: hypothetical protein [unclassified Clostridium]|uniref:hypothetical protein n=1 Tax=unclassified Clostridium TaxID=2614128 RepID=UPI0025BCEE4F|nr:MULTISPECIES: hypothetical protein [unclassified Clostridium]
MRMFEGMYRVTQESREPQVREELINRIIDEAHEGYLNTCFKLNELDECDIEALRYEGFKIFKFTDRWTKDKYYSVSWNLQKDSEGD